MKCPDCGTEFVWFSGVTSGICQHCYKHDTSGYVQVHSVSSDYDLLMKDAEALVEALEMGAFHHAGCPYHVSKECCCAHSKVEKALATWNAKYGSKK